MWSHGQAVKTRPSQGLITSSILVGITIFLCLVLKRIPMNILIGFCGLDCEKCEARKATITNDDKLREEVAKKWSELNHTSITKEMINCVGCRLEGVKTIFCDTFCLIRKCASSKGLSTCGKCPNLEFCDTVKMIANNNQEALNNLKNNF